MPANVESMFYYNEPPWHGMGTRLDHPATAAEALAAAKLDWTVSKLPAAVMLEGKAIPAEGWECVVRTDTIGSGRAHVLGVVGKGYAPLQNRDAFTFFDSIVGDGAAIYHTAGAINKGEYVWILAKLPVDIVVLGEDITEKYLLLANCHSGEAAVQVKFTPIRVVCQNTLNAALQQGRGARVPHIGDVLGKLVRSRDMLGQFVNAYDQIAQLFVQMGKTPVTQRTIDDYLGQLFPLPDDEKERVRVLERREAVVRLNETGPGSDIPGVRGSLWGLYNAVVAEVDYGIQRRTPDSRLKSIWFGGAAAFKQKALNVAASVIR
ncbi:MAG: DUF932 domain-containing protein [candidate division WOR-3 bacterium]